MQKRTTREDVNEILVSDSFFKKDNISLQLRQIFLSLIGWLAVFFPFIWLLFPVLNAKLASQFYLYTYTEVKQTVWFLLLFFSVIFLFIIVISIALTAWNNHRYKTKITKEMLVNEEMLQMNTTTLESFYTERFGKKEYRENICFYTVTAEKNIEIEDINNLYKKGEK